MKSNTKKNPIIQRVIQLRTQHFGKRGKSIFARKLGISPSTYNYYEQDRVPPADILLKMSKATGVGLGWLIAGEKTFANASNNSSNAGPGSDIGRAVEALVAENPQLRQAISVFIEIICEKNSIENPLIGSVSKDGSRSVRDAEIRKPNRDEDGNLESGSRSIQGESVVGGDKCDDLRSETGSVDTEGAGNATENGETVSRSRGVGGGDIKSECEDGTRSSKRDDIKGEGGNIGELGGARGNAGGGMRDGVGMIPVLGRTAAGIVHCWDQCGEPRSWQAETKLAELVKKYIGKDIVGSNDGKVEVDSDSAKLAGDLVGKFDRNACIVQVSSSDEGVVEFVDSFDMAKRYPDCFGLVVDGDSMRPRICDGDIVILSPSVPAKQGAIAVAKVRDQIGVTCKIVRFDGEQVHLVAGNENYETRVVERGQLIWALAVLGHVRRR